MSHKSVLVKMQVRLVRLQAQTSKTFLVWSWYPLHCERQYINVENTFLYVMSNCGLLLPVIYPTSPTHENVLYNKSYTWERPVQQVLHMRTSCTTSPTHENVLYNKSYTWERPVQQVLHMRTSCTSSPYCSRIYTRKRHPWNDLSSLVTRHKYHRKLLE